MKERTKEELLETKMVAIEVKDALVIEIIDQLIAEMEKHSENVWEEAPANAAIARVIFYTQQLHGVEVGRTTYSRALPKTRAREIAEECYSKALKSRCDEDSIAEIEAAILRREKELEEWR